jgi:hypothetical protein
MVLYKCECGHETNKKYSMKIHLNRKISCMTNKNMSIININTLCVSRINTNLSHLTIEEKKTREKEMKKQRNIKRNFKEYSIGGMTEIQYASRLLKNMKKRINENKLSIHDWTVETFLKLLQQNTIYKIITMYGILEFPMVLTNGYHNSASIDRIDDNEGYILSNIEIRPHFLNTRYKLSTKDLKTIIESKLINSFQEININYKYFYILANHAKQNKRKINFDFNSIKECTEFLIELFKQQNGKCHYSKIPIYAIHNHKYRISIERLDSTKSYNKNNIVLIVVGLNNRPSGQYKNIHLTIQQKEFASKVGSFNQEYWNKCFEKFIVN